MIDPGAFLFCIQMNNMVLLVVGIPDACPSIQSLRVIEYEPFGYPFPTFKDNVGTPLLTGVKHRHDLLGSYGFSSYIVNTYRGRMLLHQDYVELTMKVVGKRQTS